VLLSPVLNVLLDLWDFCLNSVSLFILMRCLDFDRTDFLGELDLLKSKSLSMVLEQSLLQLQDPALMPLDVLVSCLDLKLMLSAKLIETFDLPFKILFPL
jgi:hypothetical protein